jgi:hypothetical protein
MIDRRPDTFSAIQQAVGLGIVIAAGPDLTRMNLDRVSDQPFALGPWTRERISQR